MFRVTVTKITKILALVASLTFAHSAFSNVTATFNSKFVDDIPKKIAVIPQSEGSYDEIELAGIVTSVLMSLDFDVMERTSLDLLLKEYKLSLSGLLLNRDPEIGKVLNLDAIIIVVYSSYSYTKTVDFFYKGHNYPREETKSVINASLRMIDIISGAVVYQFTYSCDTGQFMGQCTGWNTNIGKYLKGDLSKKKKIWGEFRFSSSENVTLNSVPKTDLSLKGKVEFVGSATLWIDVGAKQGVQTGDIFYVTRNNKTIGRVKVRTIYDSYAEVLRVEGDDDDIVIGDDVSYVVPEELKPLGDDGNKTEDEATGPVEAKNKASNNDDATKNNAKVDKEIIGKIEGIGNEKAWVDIGGKQGLVTGDTLYLIRESKIIGKVKVINVNDATSEVSKIEGEEPALGDEVRCIK